MTFRGPNSWRPNSRRHRRRGTQGGAPQRSTSEEADRAFLVIVAVFSLVALAVAVTAGIFLL